MAEMAQQLRTPATLAKDPRFNFWHTNTCNSSSRESNLLFGLPQVLHACGEHTEIQQPLIHTKKGRKEGRERERRIRIHEDTLDMKQEMSMQLGAL